MSKQIFIVPREDEHIIDMLKRNGFKEGENLFITECKRYAPWSEVEPKIKAAIKEAKQEQAIPQVRVECILFDNEFCCHRDTRVMSLDDYRKLPVFQNTNASVSGTTYSDGEPEEMPPKLEIQDIKVYAVHIFTERNKSVEPINELFGFKSTIEQIADLIGYQLNMKEAFLDVNEKNGHMGMKELADKYHFTKERTEEMIQEIESKYGTIFPSVMGTLNVNIDATCEQVRESIKKYPYQIVNGYLRRWAVNDEMKNLAKRILISETRFYSAEGDERTGFEIHFSFARFVSTCMFKAIAERMKEDPIIADHFYLCLFRQENADHYIILVPADDTAITLDTIEEVLIHVQEELGFKDEMSRIATVPLETQVGSLQFICYQDTSISTKNYTSAIKQFVEASDLYDCVAFQKAYNFV